MAKDSSTKKPKKQRWYHTIIEAYRITKKSFPWAGWGLLGAAAVGLLIGVGLSLAFHSWFWMITGVMLAMVLPMFLLVRLVRRASYAQIDGMTGAVSAVLDNIGRGWNVKTEPVRFNARSQDLLFRAIGRPGIVLITEGPLNRVRGLVNDERRSLKRIAPNTPIHVINVGNDEGQTKLINLDKSMRKLPRQISAAEVAALANRLDALSSNALPMPKGVDPMKARANRRALRGM